MLSRTKSAAATQRCLLSYEDPGVSQRNADWMGEVLDDGRQIQQSRAAPRVVLPIPVNVSSIAPQRTWLTYGLAAVALLIAGCGGTYVNDSNNFERALRIPNPGKVKVMRSIYWQSPHFTDEHCYYLELKTYQGSTLLQTLTSPPEMQRVGGESLSTLPSLALERPRWFAPKPISTYEVWISTNKWKDFGVLRDPRTGRIFVYGQSL